MPGSTTDKKAVRPVRPRRVPDLPDHVSPAQQDILALQGMVGNQVIARWMRRSENSRVSPAHAAAPDLGAAREEIPSPRGAARQVPPGRAPYWGQTTAERTSPARQVSWGQAFAVIDRAASSPWGAQSTVMRQPARASWGADETYDVAMSEIPPLSGAGKFTYRYGGKKALTGYFGEWEATSARKGRVVRKGGQWYGVLQRFHLRATFWVKSGSDWDHIKDFPGGAYVKTYNARGGPWVHEVAELKAIGRFWRTAQRNIMKGIAPAFATKQGAIDNFNAVEVREVTAFMAKYNAIKDHTNPVGPNAEWRYYERLYQQHKARAGGAAK